MSENVEKQPPTQSQLKEVKDPNRASLRFKKLALKQKYEALVAETHGKLSFNEMAEQAFEIAYPEIKRRAEMLKQALGFQVSAMT